MGGGSLLRSAGGSLPRSSGGCLEWSSGGYLSGISKLEAKTGKKVVTSLNSKDALKTIPNESASKKKGKK